MAVEFKVEEKGVIIDASADHAIVKVRINKVDRKFTFSKNILYLFGIKCEGQMSNILEKGMEVNVLYKLGPNQYPCIIALWLGGKPDNLEEEASSLKPVFDRSGHYAERNKDYDFVDYDFVVKCDDFEETVLVKESVVYYGRLLDDERRPFLDVGDSITFDAVPLHREHGAAVTFSQPAYIATCAWLGSQKPLIVTRFGIAASYQENDKSKEDSDIQDRFIEGTVAVVPSDVVAFVHVVLDGVVVKVLLFRSCFKSDQSVASQSLKDMIVVGETLSLRIGKGILYRGRKQLFAIEACKLFVEDSASIKETSFTMRVSAKHSNVENDACKLFCSEIFAFMKATSSNMSVSAKPSKAGDNGCKYCVKISANLKERFYIKKEHKMSMGDKPNAGSEGGNVSGASYSNEPDSIEPLTVNNTPEFTESSKVLFNIPPLCGSISRLSFDSASISFRNLKIYAHMSQIFVDGLLCTLAQFDELVSSGNQEVKFHAILSLIDIKQKYGTTHSATRVWTGLIPSLRTIMSTYYPPKLSLLVTHRNQTFIGIVFNFHLPKLALIDVLDKGTTATLHISEFCGPDDHHRSNEFITDFVKLGDIVEFKLFRCGSYLGANDFKLINTIPVEETMTSKDTGTDDPKSFKSVGVSEVPNSSSCEPTDSESLNVASHRDEDKQATGAFGRFIRRLFFR